MIFYIFIVLKKYIKIKKFHTIFLKNLTDFFLEIFLETMGVRKLKIKK